jgi:dihydrolipoamide dehydrogenase
VVGVEMADAFNALGSEVVLVEPSERLIGREEAFAGEELREALLERRVDIRLGATVAHVGRDDAGVVHATLGDGASIESDEILLAVGRRPLTHDLGLETVGIEPGKYMEVDDQYRVPGLPWLYAIGDVNGRSLLTHMGKYQAHVVSEVLAGHGDDERPPEIVGPPRVIFTEPQVAAVGLTLQAAADRGLDAHAYDVPSSATAGASFHGRNVRGTSRIVVDEEHELLAGATFVGQDVAEWLHAATIAIASRTPVELLWHAVPAFPTRSEVWLKLLERREAELQDSRRQARAAA